jgi:hypothetical protein
MRTEEEVLKDFEKLDYKILENTDRKLVLIKRIKNPYTLENIKIVFYKEEEVYRKFLIHWKTSKTGKIISEPKVVSFVIFLQEHKLLNELFSIWGWL